MFCHNSAIAPLMGGNPNGFHNMVEKIHELVRKLHVSGVSVEILWVAGHAGLAANEIADRAAKEAAKNAADQNTIISNQVNLSEVKSQCQCGRDTGTMAHFLLHCPLHTQAREALISNIELGYQTTNTPPHLKTLDIKTLLGSNQDLSSDMLPT